MIRKYTHWFLMGGVLCTDTTDNESMSAAANMFSADIKGITTPGYTVVPDSELIQLREDKAQLLERAADGWHGGLVDLMRKEVDRLRSQARLTETQQAAQRILGENDVDQKEAILAFYPHRIIKFWRACIWFMSVVYSQ